MQFSWDQNTINWRIDAEKYTRFYSKVAELVLPHIGDCKKVCDVGCGMGLFDMALAESGKEITCIDQNEQVINWLEAEAKRRNLTNIYPRVGDGNEINDKWDAITLLFAGDKFYYKLLNCCKKMIMITHHKEGAKLYPTEYGLHPKFSYKEVTEVLDEKCIPYKVENYSLEFGQPFRDRESAVAFVKSLAHGIPDEEAVEYVNSRVRAIDDDEFKLYFPKVKHFALLEIQGFLK